MFCRPRRTSDRCRHPHRSGCRGCRCHSGGCPVFCDGLAGETRTQHMEVGAPPLSWPTPVAPRARHENHDHHACTSPTRDPVVACLPTAITRVWVCRWYACVVGMRGTRRDFCCTRRQQCLSTELRHVPMQLAVAWLAPSQQQSSKVLRLRRHQAGQRSGRAGLAHCRPGRRRSACSSAPRRPAPGAMA